MECDIQSFILSTEPFFRDIFEQFKISEKHFLSLINFQCIFIYFQSAAHRQLKEPGGEAAYQQQHHQAVPLTIFGPHQTRFVNN